MSTRTKVTVSGCALVLLSGLLWGCGHEQKPAPKTAPVTAREPDPEPVYDCGDKGAILYRVSAGKKVSHVLGTVPAGFGVDDVLEGDCRVALDEAKVVILAWDKRKADEFAALGPAVLPKGRSLRKLLGTHEWESLILQVGKTMPPVLLDRVQPWYAYETVLALRLKETMEGKYRDQVPPSLDDELVDLAEEQGKEVAFLESENERSASLARVPLEAQAASLKLALAPDTAIDTSGMIAAYAEGDEERFVEATLKKGTVRQHPAFFDALVFKRNERWAEKLAPRFKRGGAFVVVDAMHLFGDASLLAKLDKKGFVVRRIR